MEGAVLAVRDVEFGWKEEGGEAGVDVVVGRESDGCMVLVVDTAGG